MEETAGTIAKESLNLGANPYLAVGLLFVVLAGLLVFFGWFIHRLNERIDSKDATIHATTDKFSATNEKLAGAILDLKTTLESVRLSNEANSNRLIDKIDNLKDFLLTTK